MLLAPDTESALTVAARANDIVARCIGWSLADGNQRAALELAEAGRGLVLASVVTAGQVEEVLRGAGEHDLADGWRHGGEPGRIAALDAFWKPELNANLLTPPTPDMISIMLAGTRADALVYLVPPEERDGEQPPPGHAILLRPVTGVIEVVELPGLATLTGRRWTRTWPRFKARSTPWTRTRRTRRIQQRISRAQVGRRARPAWLLDL